MRQNCLHLKIFQNLKPPKFENLNCDNIME